jgi:hypothetical protein
VGGINLFGQTTFTDVQLKEDLKVIKTILVELSPNYTLQDKEKAINYFDEKSEKLNGQSMDAIGFFNFLTKLQFNSKLDGHGQLELPGDIILPLISDKKVLLPVPVVIINKEVLVNNEISAIPFGSKIIAIDDVPMDKMLSEFVPDSSDFSLKLLEPIFDIRYIIEYGPKEVFNIQYQAPNSEVIQSVALPAINFDERKETFDNRIYPLNKETLKNAVFSKHLKDEDSYYLMVNSFDWQEKNKNSNFENFEKEFETIFKDIKKSKPKHLIIDLRFNSGGELTIPGYLFSYIAIENFEQSITVTIPDFDIPLQDYLIEIAKRPVKNKDDIGQFTDILKKLYIQDNEGYKYTIVDSENFKPQKNAFQGKVTLLVSGRTFSAAAYFTALFKNYKRGSIVGETVGGSHHDVTAGHLLKYRTPNTGIEISIPLQIIQFSENLLKNVPEKHIKPDLEADANTKYNSFLRKEDFDFNLLKIKF